MQPIYFAGPRWTRGGGGGMVSEYRKPVYDDGTYNDNTLSSANLKFILLVQDFFS